MKTRKKRDYHNIKILRPGVKEKDDPVRQKT